MKIFYKMAYLICLIKSYWPLVDWQSLEKVNLILNLSLNLRISFKVITFLIFINHHWCLKIAETVTKTMVTLPENDDKNK